MKRKWFSSFIVLSKNVGLLGLLRLSRHKKCPPASKIVRRTKIEKDIVVANKEKAGMKNREVTVLNKSARNCLLLMLVSFAAFGEEPEERVFQFSGAVLMLPIVAAAFCLILSILYRRRMAACIGFLVGAVLLGGFLAPMMYLDRVVVTLEKIEQTTGFWWSPTVKGFAYSGVALVRITTARDRRGRSFEMWEVHYKDGAVKEIDPGDLWVVNGAEIVSLLRKYNVSVERE
jgi:hypothetical protein